MSCPDHVGSAQVAAIARRDLGGDHPPGDRLAAWQLPEPRRGPDDHAEPAAADVPAAGADLGPGELVAAEPPQVVVMRDAATAARWGRAPASRRAAIRISAGVRTVTMTAWARAVPGDHRDGRPSSAGQGACPG
jgi:hypothetical protein